MADDIVYDEMLGELRTSDVSGGTGGTEYVGGNRINIAGGTTSFVDSADIVTVTGMSVTLQPDTAYKMYATTGELNVTANPPAANKWAYEGHAEIFVGSVGYVVFDTSKIVLANQLEPDSVNNCTLRFHDGMCYVSVEDHIAGYIVVNGSTSGEGSLAYGIDTSTNEYIAFDASLNGQTIPLAGAVAEGEKHVVGNGYTSTTLTGAVDCGTSKFTVANLGLNNVQVTGGVMTLGDTFIPPGSTVAVISGGGLSVEKVTGAGAESVIDLGGNAVSGNGTFSSVSLGGGTFASGALEARGGAAISLDMSSGTSLSLAGSNTIGLVSGSSAKVFVSSGAIIDLTGNTNATPIAPGGGITFAPGWATVLYGNGDNVSSMYIANAIVRNVDNAGGVQLGQGQNRNEVYSNVNISALPLGSVTIKEQNSATFTDCGFQGIYQNRATVIIGGTFSVTAYNTSFNNRSGYNASTLIEPNTVLDVHLGAPSGALGNHTLSGPMIIQNGGTATVVYKNSDSTASKTITGSGTYIGRNGETDFTVIE